MGFFMTQATSRVPHPRDGLIVAGWEEQTGCPILATASSSQGGVSSAARPHSYPQEQSSPRFERTADSLTVHRAVERPVLSEAEAHPVFVFLRSLTAKAEPPPPPAPTAQTAHPDPHTPPSPQPPTAEPPPSPSL